MRILLSNKYYYLRGGVDIYTIQLENMLRSQGHEVAIFSMQHSLNHTSSFLKYFPDEIDLTRVTMKNIIPALVRPFGSAEVRRKFSRLLRDFRPDIVHLNNIHSQISPVLSVIARKNNIPVVWTLHDHKLLCPRYDCMRDNQPCELCFHKKFNVLRYNCMKNSRAASFIAYGEAIIWNRRRLSRYTDLFICPSRFLFANMVKGGFPGEKMTVLPNFLDEIKLNVKPVPRGQYYCYVGRLSTEKGVETLLKAAKELPEYTLKVLGTGPLESELKAKYVHQNIEFLGFRNWPEMSGILAGSACMVLPSECYENNPLSIIESHCLGTPVIGSAIGGIPELIESGKNGLVFEPGNIIQLKKAIESILKGEFSFDHDAIMEKALSDYNPRKYYGQLIAIYNKLVTRHLTTGETEHRINQQTA